MSTTMDKSTVAANFESIPNPLAAYTTLLGANPLCYGAAI
jgi:hypothetical protein